MAKIGFSGGRAITQKLNTISSRISTASEVRVGFLEGSTYPDGTPTALVAAVQEFGSPANNIPPRPFFRNMIAAKKQEWGPAIANLLQNNGYDAENALNQTGETVGGQLRQSIQNTNAPPLAPATIKRKGFNKPLISTGHLWNSIDYEVN